MKIVFRLLELVFYIMILRENREKLEKVKIVRFVLYGLNITCKKYNFSFFVIFSKILTKVAFLWLLNVMMEMM